MTGTFKRSLKPRATSRAKKSVDAPGVIPTTILIGLLLIGAKRIQVFFSLRIFQKSKKIKKD
jgi:hypothetical protein